MQIFDYNKYKWNHCCASYGNLGHVDPSKLADLCDKHGIPWYTDGWPYSSGIKVYCMDEELWKKLLNQAKDI